MNAEAVNYKKSFLWRALQAPSYGYDRDGEFYTPTNLEILQEYGRRLNIFKTRKNWIAFWFLISFIWGLWNSAIYFSYYFSWASLFFAGAWFVLQGHLWDLVHHRGLTHGAFKFKNQFWSQLFRIISTPLYPEEIYDFAHKCHHQFSDKPGDPYFPKAGLFYLFFTDVNHQLINHHLSREEYATLRRSLSRYVLFLNSYETYLKWGTLAHPAIWIPRVVAIWLGQFLFFYWLGGPSFGYAFCLSLFIMGVYYRTINFCLHGYGHDKRRPGQEFNDDWAYNHWWAILSAGQWHGHHHLYPRSANTGLMSHQTDLPFRLVRLLEHLGIVTDVQNAVPDFERKYLGGASRTGTASPVHNC